MPLHEHFETHKISVRVISDHSSLLLFFCWQMKMSKLFFLLRTEQQKDVSPLLASECVCVCCSNPANQTIWLTIVPASHIQINNMAKRNLPRGVFFNNIIHNAIVSLSYSSSHTTLHILLLTAVKVTLLPHQQLKATLGTRHLAKNNMMTWEIKLKRK